MAEQNSELIELSRLHGDFKRNYGKLVGAYRYLRYLRSVSAVRGRSYFWNGFFVTALTAGLAWLERYGVPWLRAQRPGAGLADRQCC